MQLVCWPGVVDRTAFDEEETGRDKESSDSASEVILQIFMLAAFKELAACLSCPQQQCGFRVGR